MQEKIVIMGIFIICAQAVIHFCPGNVYAKYLRLLLSMMVLVQLLQPVLEVTLGKASGLQDITYGLWKQLDSEWGQEWKTVAGYEEQIDAIWERQVEEKARNYLAETDGTQESGEYAPTLEKVHTDEVEKVVVQIEPIEKIRIGE